MLTLMTGTSIAQAIPVAISPILTRIYSPEDFGLFAIYMALASVLGLIATGRYELAIMLPEKDEDAANIVILSALLAFAIGLVLLVAVFLLDSRIAYLLGNADIKPWLYLIPFSVFLTGVSQSLSYWVNRSGQYSNIAKSRIIQSSMNGGVQLGVGHAAKISGGMIIGSVAGLFAGVISLAYTSDFAAFRHGKRLAERNVIDLAIQYKKYPLLASWGALLDGAAIQVPVFFITKIFGSAITGLFSMTFKILNMPMTLISSAIAQVLFQRISAIHNNEPEKLRGFILKALLLLTVLAMPMVAVLGIFGPALFGFVFGAKWIAAGHYASILSIAIAVRFVVSPLSSVLALEHNISKGVAWQVLYFCTLTGTLSIAAGLYIEKFLLIFVIHEVVLYGLYLILIVWRAKMPIGVS